MLAAPLNCQILWALREGARQQGDLRRGTGHPPQTTLRAQLKKLSDAGAIAKQRRNRFPGVLEYELSESGRDLLPVSAILEGWLRESPDGALELGDASAKASVKALTDGWSTAMLRALAAKPLTLTELDGVISSLNYPSLERRLSAMRLTGLVETSERDGRGTPYYATEWARRGVAPLMAACRWEHRHARTETSPLAKLDIETIFLLAADLLSPPIDASGACRFTVEIPSDRRPVLAGLLLVTRDGHLVSRSTRLEGDAEAWVIGSPAAWFAAITERDRHGLELGGDTSLSSGLLNGLHDALFGGYAGRPRIG